MGSRAADRASRRSSRSCAPTDGRAGYASGDRLPDAALLGELLVGLDPRRTEVVRELCETVDFHGARPWIAEVAVWDLAARALGEPLWRLLGGRSERLLAYASSGELVAPEERARRVAALRDAGVRAVKLRFHHADWRDDVAVVEAVRDAVGARRRADGRREPGLADGGRPLGALGRRHRRAVRPRARAARRVLAGGAAARPTTWRATRRCGACTSLRIAAGEMVRSAAEARDLLLRGGVDVIQPDVVLSGGLGGCRRIAGARRPVRARVLAAHVVERPRAASRTCTSRSPSRRARTSRCRYDPPAWTPERRDWLLPAPVEIAADGTIAPPPGPGLGVEPDLDALERWRVA